MHNFLCQNVLILNYTYCLQEKLAIYSKRLNYNKYLCITFYAKMSHISIIHIAYKKNWHCGHFGLGIMGHFRPKILEKKSTIFSDIFWITVPTFPKSLFNTLLKLLTAWLTQFYVITQFNLFTSDLAYITCTNIILWSN